jgi:hypothetical protein
MASSAHHTCWIRQEAAMAVITFNTAHQKEQARKQLETALTAYREILDTFVNNRMPRAPAEADQIPQRRIPNLQSKPVKPQ